MKMGHKADCIFHNFMVSCGIYCTSILIKIMHVFVTKKLHLKYFVTFRK